MSTNHSGLIHRKGPILSLLQNSFLHEPTQPKPPPALAATEEEIGFALQPMYVVSFHLNFRIKTKEQIFDIYTRSLNALLARQQKDPEDLCSSVDFVMVANNCLSFAKTIQTAPHRSVCNRSVLAKVEQSLQACIARIEKSSNELQDNVSIRAFLA